MNLRQNCILHLQKMSAMARTTQNIIQKQYTETLTPPSDTFMHLKMFDLPQKI